MNLLLLLIAAMPLFAANDCNMSAADFDKALKNRLKFFVVHEGEQGMLNSVLDEDEIKAEAKKNSPLSACLRRALDIAKAAKIPAEEGIRTSLKSLFCLTRDSVSLTFTTSPTLGLTAFVRSFPKDLSELSLGGVRKFPTEPGAAGCEKMFWQNISETLALSLTVIPKLHEKIAKAGPLEQQRSPEQWLGSVLQEVLETKSFEGPSQPPPKDCP